MHVQYDHKMGGLLVEVNKAELQKLAADVCEAGSQTDLLMNDIRHVTYVAPISENATQRSAILSLGFAVLAATVGLCGLYQIGVWLINLLK